MKRTTVKIPDELDARLRNEARRRGMTISEITREALVAHLVPGAPRRRIFHGAGMFRSGRSDLASRAKEILREEMGNDAMGAMGREP